MDIIQKIKKLNLPIGEYVIIGSGLLGVLGIREAHDIDIAVTKDLHKKLMDTGEWEKQERWGKIFLKKDVFEIIPELQWDAYDTTTEKAIKEATIIDGVPFTNLDELIKFKIASGRGKDLEDLVLIEKYKEVLSSK